MIGQSADSGEGDYDPGSMPAASFTTTKLAWHRRPWVMVTAAIVAIVAFSVISDLPHHITTAQDAGDQNAAISQIKSDLATCEYAVKESFNFYRLDVAGRLSPSNFNLAYKTLLPEDELNCSFVTGSLVDMTGNLQIVRTRAGKVIELMRLDIVHWIAHDARNAIKDVIFLFAHPGDPATLQDLSTQENFLAQDRLSAYRELAHASAILGVTLEDVSLPVVPRLPGT